jgi:hypothetical protein
MCADQVEWERLKLTLNLMPVRRHGYRKGSPLDDLGTRRVIRAADLPAFLTQAPDRMTWARDALSGRPICRPS